MKQYERAYALVHLDRIEENMVSMQQNLKPGTMMIGVVKTDGYGHGAVPVAKTIAPFVSGYAVATADEALELRRHGITKGILVLGVTAPCRYEELIREEIRPAIFQLEKAELLSKLAVKLKKPAKLHLAVDTGMSRIGMVPDEESADMAAKMAALPGIEIEGMFTHFARADETDKGPARTQLKRYMEFAGMLEARGIRIPVRHCSNSAGIVDLKEANLDAVRAGITIYGLYPSGEVDQKAVPLKPAMELKSFVTYVKEIGPGTEISYGGTFKAETDMRIATVGIGYGDGYPRNLSGKGEVLICGKRAPILGRICMDQLMVDVTDIPDAAEESVVTLLGKDGEEEITMEELAERCGGFHYEIPCVLGKRVPRVYMERGRRVGSKEWFCDRYEGFL